MARVAGIAAATSPSATAPALVQQIEDTFGRHLVPTSFRREVVTIVVPDAGTAPALKSWDRTRPLVLALAETPHHGLPGTIAASWPLYLRALPGLRHQILVPATDPAALAAALGQQFAALGPTAATRFAGRATGAWALGEGDWLAVVPEADAVRVVVVRGSLFPEGFFADPARASLRGDLPEPGAVAATAGASVLAGEAHAGVLVRPQRLPALWTWWQARDGLDLIRSAVASRTYLHLRTSLASPSSLYPSDCSSRATCASGAVTAARRTSRRGSRCRTCPGSRGRRTTGYS